MEVEGWRGWAWEREGLAAWTAAVVAPGDFVAMARERVGGA